jgi:hypothetical protein
MAYTSQLGTSDSRLNDLRLGLSADNVVAGSATFAHAATLAVVGTLVTPFMFGAATFAHTASLEAAPTVATYGAATFAHTATLSVQPNVPILGSATFAHTASLSAAPSVSMAGAATFAHTASLSISGLVLRTYKHVDFEVPSWGELAYEPTTASPIAITQATAAAYPDRGSVGARVVAPAGDGTTGYVAHDLGAEQALLHARLLVRVHSWDTGTVTVMDGLDAADATAWSLVYDHDAGTMTATASTGETASWSPPTGLGWHCVEVVADEAAGTLALYGDGELRATATGVVGSLATQTVRAGAIGKAPGSSGELHLDEWRLANRDVGPVRVAPRESMVGTSAYAAAGSGSWEDDPY